MMTPFSIQNLLIRMSAIKYLKHQSLVAEKFKFCTEFEKELRIEKSEYSEDVFDFIYNLYNYKKAFKDNRFKNIIEDLMDADFREFLVVKHYMEAIYNEMVFLNREYFYSILKIQHDDPEYISKRFLENIKENRKIILENF